MNKEEIKNIFTTIDKINSPYYEISRERMYKIKERIEELNKKLQEEKEENKKLKEEYKNEIDENLKLSELWCKSRTNWSELKEWLKEIHLNGCYIDEFTIIEVRNKVEEIESRK